MGYARTSSLIPFSVLLIIKILLSFMVKNQCAENTLLARLPVLKRVKHSNMV